MKNKIGFIPKSYPVQPDYYRDIFNHWAAIFIVDDGTTLGKEYHLQLGGGDFFNGCKEARFVEILKQNKDCRTNIFQDEFKSIKSAYEQLLKVIKK